MIEYIDATGETDAPVLFPERVDEFLSLGFDLVGRYRGEPTEGSLEDLAAGYGERAGEFLENAPIPTPVLRSPGGDAFAEVGWWWGTPALQIRTMLQDGSLVQSARRWDEPPPMPDGLRTYWRTVDIDEEMTRSHNPPGGRSIEIVADCSPTELWAHHVEHVHRYAHERRASPARHDDVADALAIAERAFAHDAAVHRGFTRLWIPLLLLYAVVALVAIALAVTVSTRTVAALVAAAFAVFTWPAMRLIIGRVRSLPIGWRPAMTD